MKKNKKLYLDNNYKKNNVNYFFSIFNDRFLDLSNLLKEILEKKYNSNFEPIHIINSNYHNFFDIKNYVYFKRIKDFNLNKVIDYDELNYKFSKSKKVKNIIDNLSLKQDFIFVNSFTSYRLDIESYSKKVINIGQDGEIIEFLDDKINQLKIFEKIKINIPEFNIFKNIYQLEKFINSKKVQFPLFCSYNTSHGGSGNLKLDSVNDFNIFKKKIKKSGYDFDGRFFLAEYIKNIKNSPSSQALMCGKNDVRVLAITDQILKDEIKFEGNIYPSNSSEKVKKEIISMTEKLGKYLSKIGFRGYFGCDFVVDQYDNVYIIELNPRRTAPYLMVLLMLAKKNINLLECELNIELGDEIHDFTYKDCQVDFVWAHKKVISDSKYVKIKKEVKKNSEQYVFDNIGSVSHTNYFKKNHIINNHIYGYTVVTGHYYDDVLKRINRESEKLKKETIEEIDVKSLKKKKK